MKNVFSAVLAGAVASALLVGCSSSDDGGEGGGDGTFGADPDFASVSAAIEKPTGTFSAENSGAVVASAGEQQTKAQESSGLLSGIGGSSSANSTSMQALIPQQAAGGQPVKMGEYMCQVQSSTSGTQQNAQGQAVMRCTCNTGTFDFQAAGIQQGAQGGAATTNLTMRGRWSQCELSKMKIDGAMFVQFQGAAGASNSADAKIVYWLKAAVTRTGQTTNVDLSFLQQGGKQWLVVKTDDGNVAVSTQGFDPKTKTGTVVIKDKNDTYTCVYTAGKGTCKGEKNTTEFTAN